MTVSDNGSPWIETALRLLYAVRSVIQVGDVPGEDSPRVLVRGLFGRSGQGKMRSCHRYVLRIICRGLSSAWLVRVFASQPISGLLREPVETKFPTFGQEGRPEFALLFRISKDGECR